MFFVESAELQLAGEKVKEMMRLARSLSESAAHGLIWGAQGTGKTTLAHWVHTNSRPGYDLLTVYGRSYSHDKEKIERQILDSRNSTFLVESVDYLTLEDQEHLLSLLQKAAELAHRPRFLFTSRRDVRQLVRQELFRHDLYYRMAVFNIELPSLQGRSNDILLMAQFFIQVHQIIHASQINKHLTPAAAEKLISWSWPGNISELENVIERAVALSSSSEICESHLIFESGALAMGGDFGLGLSLSEVEKRLIMQTLEMTSQNRTKAAQILGISIRTLRNKLNEYKEAQAV